MHTVTIKLTREDLLDDFKVEPQVIITEAHLSTTMLVMLETKINALFKDRECFVLIATIQLEVEQSIAKSFIDKFETIQLTKVLDYNDNSLLPNHLVLGKIRI